MGQTVILGGGYENYALFLQAVRLHDLCQMIMNAFQFWVTDNFIKKAEDSEEGGQSELEVSLAGDRHPRGFPPTISFQNTRSLNSSANIPPL